MEYTIRCPYHERDETIEVPGNPVDLDGETPCSPRSGETPGILKIKIIHGLLVDASLTH